ncbi:MAG TPA: hypothetical protein VHU91_02250, partial [Mycobacteriales bacterium]|nr:hypothetical protein [Mycobacteriales bacterium]
MPITLRSQRENHQRPNQAVLPTTNTRGTTSQQRLLLPAYRQGHCLSSGLNVQETGVLTCRPATTRSVPD